MRNHTIVYSIFGQIEAVAAQVMIDHGLATKIPYEDIPETVRFNEAGQHALFVIVLMRNNLPTFEQVISNLRA